MMSDACFEIVLFQPRIPQNTGNIGRLCVNTGSRLHLIKPFAFSLDDASLKRAGLDYWPYLDLKVHESWGDFLAFAGAGARLFIFSTKGEKVFWDAAFEPGDFLVFGNETEGLSPEIHEGFGDRLLTIPMYGEHARSYNLANSVAVALFEGLRRGRHMVSGH